MMVLATLFLTFQDAVIKSLTQLYSVWQLVCTRFAVPLVVVTAVDVLKGQVHVLQRARGRTFQLLRGVVRF